jgi:hypothetical protein
MMVIPLVAGGLFQKPKSEGTGREKTKELIVKKIEGRGMSFTASNPKKGVLVKSRAKTRQKANKRKTELSPVEIGRRECVKHFGRKEWKALYELWVRESGWKPYARNPSSGACGIPQSLPCSKIKDQSTGGQIAWGIQYIKQRYGTPSRALKFHDSHNWY